MFSSCSSSSPGVEVFDRKKKKKRIRVGHVAALPYDAIDANWPESTGDL